MAIIRIRPNESSIGSGNWIVQNSPAGSTLHSAVADDSTATNIQSAFGVPNNFVRFGFTNIVLPELAQIKSVTPVIVASTGSQSRGIFFSLLLSGRNGPISSFPANSVERLLPGTPSVRQPSGAPLTVAAINNISMDITAADGAAASVVKTVYIEINYNEAPVTTVNMPTTITNDSQPTVNIGYTDPEGDGKERHHLKIFTPDQYNAANFTPDFSFVFTPIYDSGEVYSSDFTIPVLNPLTNNTYRFYVKTSDLGSGGRYGNWAFAQSTINLPPVTVPTLTTTYDAQNSRVEFVGTILANHRLFIERSIDNGATWSEPLITLDEPNSDYDSSLKDRAIQTSDTSVVAYDYLLPRGKPVRYRARFYKQATQSSNYSGYSNYTAQTTFTVPITGTKWLFKVPYRSALNWSFNMKGPTWERESVEVASFFSPIGRKFKVKVSDVIQGDTFALTAYIDSQAEGDKLHAIRNAQTSILIQAPDGREWWTNFTTNKTDREIFLGQTIEIDMGFEESDAVSS